MVRRPIRRTLFGALTAALALAALIAAGLAFELYRMGHERIARDRGEQVARDYAEKLISQEREWDRHVVQERTRIDFMRLLEEPKLRWLRLKAYLTTLADSPLYGGLTICNAAQQVLFQDRWKRPCYVPEPETEGRLHFTYDPELGLFAEYDQPIWLGMVEGFALLHLAIPLDHAFLWRMRGAEDVLFIEYEGRIVAASAGESALTLARPGYEGPIKRAGLRLEQRRIPFSSAPGAPYLLIQTPVPPPFHASEMAALGLTVFALIAGVLWFTLGRWLTGFLPRIERLALAAREFATEDWQIDSLRRLYAEAGGKDDELDAVACAGTQMVEAICQRERLRSQAEAELRTAEERFREIAEFAGAFVWEMDASWRFRFVSQGAAAVFGRPLEEVFGQALTDFVPQEQRATFQQRLEAIRAAGEPFRRLECGLVTGAEEARQIALSGLPVRDAHGNSTGRYRGIAEDVTQRRRDAEKLRLAEKVFEHSAQGILVTDAQTRIVSVNPAFTAITGYSAEDAVSEKPGRFVSGRYDAAFYAALWDKLNATGHWSGEVWGKRKNGEEYPVWLSINAVRDAENASVSHYVAIFSDISEQKASAARIEHLAYHDPLTGLPNRYALHTHLEQSLATARRNQRGLALMFIDLDRFKSINDTLGHDVGDQLLVTVARRIREAVRESDTVARLGGDEFVVVAGGLNAGAEDAARIAEKVIAAVDKPMRLSGHALYVTPSVGIALYPEDGTTAESLIKNADIAMYHAKSAGRNAYHFFNASMNAEMGERLRLESDLHQAVERGEFRMLYQPVVDIASGAVTAVEALLRWQHPELGELLPERFLPIAEETGLIRPIGTWALATACREVAAWTEFAHLRLAVNLSARQLEAPGFIDSVRAILHETGLAPERLELEIAESATLTDSERVVEFMGALAAIGVRIAIDDFGSVYSSLAYLKRLPKSRLKIDRSFVMDLEYDPNDVAITEGIIALARSLGQEATAEGIETPAQLAMLQAFGCREGQGFLFSRPLAPEALRAFLAKRRQEMAHHTPPAA